MGVGTVVGVPVASGVDVGSEVGAGVRVGVGVPVGRHTTSDTSSTNIHVLPPTPSLYTEKTRSNARPISLFSERRTFT